jgi:MbtH protein
MSSVFDDEETTFIVLVNEEGQHSLWPLFKEVPPGWEKAGPTGTRAECLGFIEANWTDMRPKTLREAHRAAGLD